MAYATPADVRDPGWGLPAGALRNITDPEIQQALASASSEADSYLSSQYTVPLTGTTPPVLAMKVCHMAAWYLLSGKGFNPQLGMDEAVYTRYKDAISWLKQIASGNAALPGYSDPGSGEEGGGVGQDDTFGVIVQSNPSRGW